MIEIIEKVNDHNFRDAIIIGRFQPFHIGHESLVDKGLEMANNVHVFIGSSQDKGSERNPLNYEFRKKIIKRIYGSKVHVYPLPDMTTEKDISPEWGRYVLKKVKGHAGIRPDLMIYGQEEDRTKWFDEKDKEGISDKVLSRSTINISGTELRDMILKDQKEEWKKFMNPKVHKMYDEISVIVKKVCS